MLPPSHHDHQAIQSVEFRHRERHLSHARALRSRERVDGILSRVVGRLASLRPVLTRRAALAAEKHELTDYACRLDDGSMGRVAIRQSDGEWIAVCVRPA